MSRHSRAPRHPFARRVVASLVAIALTFVVTALDLPAAFGGFVPKITNDSNTAATGAYFTCNAAALGEAATKPYFSYPFSEASGTTATDISGNNRPGTYSNATLNNANTGANAVCPRDKKTFVTLNGFSSYIAGPTAGVPTPTAFSVEVWFRAIQAAGVLWSFGNNRTAAATTRIAQVYVDTTARLRFAIQSGGTRYSVGNADSVVGGTTTWHHGIATFSTTAGMALYVDGVAATPPSPNPKTIDSVGTGNAGFWKLGYENVSGLPVQPYTGYFAGALAFASMYTYAMTPTQAANHFAAGRPTG